MENQEIITLLQQLHDEIKNTRAVDEKGTGLLRELEVDIHALLERSEENPSQLHQASVQRLEDTLYHFETTHPNLTLLVSKLLESLSNAGI